MKPILLKGHTRAITNIVYNKQGDVLFSTAKDNSPCAWYADTGERLGTYDGHTGAVWHCDVNEATTLLLTGSADNSAKLWEVESGREIASFKHNTPVRAVGFAMGDRHFLTVQDSLMGHVPVIFIWNLSTDPHKQPDKPILKLEGHSQKVNRAKFGPNNDHIYSVSDDGTCRLWDPETGKEIFKIKDNKKPVMDIEFSKDRGSFITCSHDQTARLYDVRTRKCMRKYEVERPLNTASISPLMDHVAVGGGQDAASVTTTHGRMGRFETTFFHKIFEDELGSVKGHFGPIHSLQFNPNGRSFASGSEDGFVRIHHFDPAYFLELEKQQTTFIEH